MTTRKIAASKKLPGKSVHPGTIGTLSDPKGLPDVHPQAECVDAITAKLGATDHHL